MPMSRKSPKVTPLQPLLLRERRGIGANRVSINRPCHLKLSKRLSPFHRLLHLREAVSLPSPAFTQWHHPDPLQDLCLHNLCRQGTRSRGLHLPSPPALLFQVLQRLRNRLRSPKHLRNLPCRRNRRLPLLLLLHCRNRQFLRLRPRSPNRLDPLTHNQRHRELSFRITLRSRLDSSNHQLHR